MVNNNAFYNITEYLLNIAENIELVNTTLFARTEDKDLYKNNLYPLVHINPQSSPLSLENGFSLFTYEIGVLNQRINDKRGTDKLNGDFNIIDNFNTTNSIINEMISEIQLNLGSEYIISEITNAEPIYYEDNNGLDGWVFSLTIGISNNVDFC